MVTREGGINRYSMDGPGGINFVAKFGMLDHQLSFGEEWWGGCGGKRLGVGESGQLFDLSFYVINEFGCLQLVECREYVFFDFL